MKKGNNMSLTQKNEESNTLELIGFKYNKYLYEVCSELKIYDLSIPVDDEQISTLLKKNN